MANAQKYTRAACGHLAAHYERRKDEKGEYVKFGNQDIDPQKSHLNYNLAPRRGVEQIDFIRQRTTEARTRELLPTFALHALRGGSFDPKISCFSLTRIKLLVKQKNALRGEIEALQTEKEILTAAEVEAIKGEKTLLGGLKGVTHKEFEAVKRTAAAVESMTAERDQALARAERADLRATAAEAKVESAYADANRQLQAKIREVEQDRPSMKAQMEIVQLRKENQTLKTENSSLRGKVADLEAMVRRLGQIIREKLPEVYAAITQPKRDRQQPPQKQKPKSRDLER